MSVRGQNDPPKTGTGRFTKSWSWPKIAAPINRRRQWACRLSTFVSLFLAFFAAKRPLKTGSGRSLKDIGLNGIRNANMAAVSVAIKRDTAHKGYKSNAVFTAGWDDHCRGRPPFGPGEGHTLRDTGTRCLAPSGWGTSGGGSAGRPRRRQPSPGTAGNVAKPVLSLFWGAIIGKMERGPRIKVHQVAEALTMSAGLSGVATRRRNPTQGPSQTKSTGTRARTTQPVRRPWAICLTCGI